MLTLTVAAVVLAACGDGGGDEPTGLDDPSASAPAETTSAETPADETPAETSASSEPTRHEFPDAGVTVLEPVPSSDAEGAALGAYVDFLREWRLSLREVRMSDALRGLAVAPVLESVQSSLDYQEENGIRYSGSMEVTPVVEETGERTVVLGGCMDVSALTIVDDGEEQPIDGIDEHPVKPIRVVLADDGTGWKVNENTVFEEESC